MKITECHVAGDALIVHTSHREAGEFANGFKPGDYEFKLIRRKRSLDANAYFHALIQQIAERQGLGFDEVKRTLVIDYGTMARDDDGQIIAFKLKSRVNVDNLYPYTKAYKTMWENGKRFTCYIAYKHTSDMDSTEFSRLLDGTVYEAKTLGIPTLDDERLKQIIKDYKL